MEAEKGTTPMFDWSLYGLLIRKARIDMGYKKAEHFAASIWRRTRVTISRDSLYKIEQGRQIPDGNQFMAINMALSGNPFYPWITDMCMSNEWKEIIASSEVNGNKSSYEIPDEWQVENTQKFIAEWDEEKMGVPYSGEYGDKREIAHLAFDDENLFEHDLGFSDF